jgi:hypothetical protein
MSRSRLTLFELNEYNVALLKQGAEVFNLPHLSQILTLNEISTRTDDTYESDFLEPWAQWVSVHTGSPAKDHKIKHLGDVPSLGRKQLWEALSDMGISSGVWGAMNASRGNAVECKFFLPDPWTFSEPGYPNSIKNLLQLPRYLAKNYGQLSLFKILKFLPSFLGSILTPKILMRLLSEAPALIKNLIKYRGAHFVYICFADLILSDVFLMYKEKWDPQFCVIFLNSLAHTQHHHWLEKDISQNAKLKHCLTNIDRIFAKVLRRLEGENLIVFNGLSQKNTTQDPSWILYRQFDHQSFLKTLGLTPLKVEALMTHDAHIFFKTETEALAAKKILQETKIGNKPLFLVESYKEAPERLFYRLVFTDDVSMEETFSGNGKSFKFGDHFAKIVQRTGKHIPVATAFANWDPKHKPVYNHEIYDMVMDFYRPHGSL